jgi:hypothetical protein
MDYLSAIIYTSMILDFNESVNGSSLSLPAHGRAGARATSFLVALFAKRKTNFKLIGLPFYNEQLKREFEEALESKILG